MNDRIGPADAARALREIDRRREQVIRRSIVPVWFWWAQAALTVALAACVESGRGVVPGIGIALFVVGSSVINRPVSRAARAAPLNRALAAPGNARRVLAVLAASIAVLLGVAVGTAFGLHAAGVSDPGMIAAAVASVLFAVGGPMLVRYEAAVLVRRSGSRR
jgi:hypothetical protein